jgi:L-cysteine:1D-myo-inositol 2-amino-2-deoxy-alpha-D-glucopyranoside ligase
VRLYDTRTRSVRPLRAPLTVRLYVCGITPYDASHLGHAFTYVQFDVLARWLAARGHRVRHARNVTDVDDDILRTASQRGLDFRELATAETMRFDEELAALGCEPPTATPHATAAVPAIRHTVSGLVDAGVAYALDDGRVYFDTRASARFGALSGFDRPTMLEHFAAKGGDPDALGKRDALDFLLWQPSAEGEPAWDSPWGPGRPGWHIECSTMAMEELGPTIDLHGGGSDLVFPHHDAEIAQAEHLTEQAPFTRFWLHTGMVGVDGEKMGKSEGNLVFLSDLRQRWSAAAVRRLLLQHHYRESWDYDDQATDAAAEALARWRHAAEASPERDDRVEDAVAGALDDDLDIPAALAEVDRAAADGAGGTVAWAAGLLGISLQPAARPVEHASPPR